jgi:xylulose-5-phosphate/fructose-6-phosphate phosphoketolase
VIDVIDRVPDLGPRAAAVRQLMLDRLADHVRHVTAHGDDMAEIRNWAWAR